jgi:hypothetical protein
MREQEVRELYEAYRQVHQLQEEVEQLDEDIQGAVDDATKRVQSGLEKLGLKINRTPKGTTTKKEQQDKIKQNVPLNNSFDLFDTILEHLVAEGFADTNEAALAIMANMSEEWKQSIVEGEENKEDSQKPFTGEGPKKPKGWRPTGPKLKSGQRPGYAR